MRFVIRLLLAIAFVAVLILGVMLVIVPATVNAIDAFFHP